MTPRLLPWLITLLAACGSAGVEGDTGTAAAPVPQPADAITKTTENGPVKATVALWPSTPALGDSIYLRFTVNAPAGVQVEAPFQDAGDQRLGRFRIVGFDQDTRRDGSGGTTHEQTYTLEAQISGRHRVPPLRLEMLDTRAGAPGRGSGSTAAVQELLTDEIAVVVAPVDAAAADAALAPALDGLPETVGGTSWAVMLGLVSGVAVLGAGSILALRAYRTRRRVEAQRSAYDDAVAQLRSLADGGAPDAAGADAWFVALSAIVRRYVEQRYDIRAPDLTTEEFLVVAASRSELREAHRQLLVQFLEGCDRVKFAGYRPDAEESLATLAAARGFVEDTRLAVAVAGARGAVEAA